MLNLRGSLKYHPRWLQASKFYCRVGGNASRWSDLGKDLLLRGAVVAALVAVLLVVELRRRERARDGPGAAALERQRAESHADVAYVFSNLYSNFSLIFGKL